MLSIDRIAEEQQLSILAIKSKLHEFTLALLIFGVVSAILNNVEKAVLHICAKERTFAISLCSKFLDKIICALLFTCRED